MIKVGITGGIGSGKTTFCQEWEEQGAFVIYADDFAKKLMSEDSGLKQKIIDAFGASSYLPTGELNRAYLAEEAFSKGRVEELNELVHPVLQQRLLELAAAKEKEGIEVFAEEAAVLLNKGRPDMFDYVVVILANERQRIDRVAERDEAQKEDIIARIRKQPDFESKTQLADFVIINNGTLEELKEKARELYSSIKTINS
ncbi:MAG: dephospho-CoA kinase [Balneolaceae bacterium]|nr:dephospho-CoA kinase [Balneolaceae bacterium]